MGLYVTLTAVGRFQPEASGLLDFPAEAYRATRRGTPVITDLFGIWEGTHAGIEFAECLGITDVWDFNQHRIDPQRADLGRLRALFVRLSDDHYATELSRFEALRDLGFEFYFEPNG
jgi:hypothetical protein